MSPSIQPVYDDRSTAMIVMVILICVLVLLTILFLCLWLGSRRMLKKEQVKIKPVITKTELPDKELQVISEYRKLDTQGKELVNNTIQTLNSKSKNE